MDLVYTVSSQSRCNDLELKYSLRSMVKHLHGFNRVIIVGHLPEFLKDVIHIPAEDPHVNNRARNIYEKILKACQHPETSNEFICASDDHFLLEDHNASHFPFYQCGSLDDCFRRLGKNNYYKSHVESTMQALTDRGLPTTNFNVHSPIAYMKHIFPIVM